MVWQKMALSIGVKLMHLLNKYLSMKFEVL